MVCDIYEDIESTTQQDQLRDTHKAHRFPHTVLKNFEVSFVTTFRAHITYAFTGQVKLLVLQFREDFQKFLKKANKLTRELFFGLLYDNKLRIMA